MKRAISMQSKRLSEGLSTLYISWRNRNLISSYSLMPPSPHPLTQIYYTPFHARPILNTGVVHQKRIQCDMSGKVGKLQRNGEFSHSTEIYITSRIFEPRIAIWNLWGSVSQNTNLWTVDHCRSGKYDCRSTYRTNVIRISSDSVPYFRKTDW